MWVLTEKNLVKENVRLGQPQPGFASHVTTKRHFTVPEASHSIPLTQLPKYGVVTHVSR